MFASDCRSERYVSVVLYALCCGEASVMIATTLLVISSFTDFRRVFQNSLGNTLQMTLQDSSLKMF